MARLIQASRRTLTSHYSLFHKTLIPQLNHLESPQIKNPIFQTRNYISEMRKSTFEGHILRVLRNEIQYETEYAPPKQPVKEFNSFTVEDRAGEQWIRLTSKHENKEKIKVEVTMFDGAKNVNEDATENDEMQLHLSFIVDISKGEGSDIFQFVCSAWPDSIEIEKVFFVKRNGMPTLPNVEPDCNEIQNMFFLKRNGMPKLPYVGPDFKDLDDELQDLLIEYLDERGVNDDLAVFLHDYMMNKDRIELIRWMGKVKSFLEN
ncbi:hypothetical protein IFM89_009539 [Coptis chinensis]|uniref:Mitochondrial glycoprotein n=1 Tax=Coptis chinensis TaxID=261450 RepID=A0A835I9C4_9MAGN|nr:hypothetical protein IFM89_009539 [Coptis chinensis]